MAEGDTFDCFLSHNSKDKPAVRALAEELRTAGVSLWLDEEQLRPGLSWMVLLESGIRASRSIAVLVGADGLGPWEAEEMEAALLLAVQEQRPVIPVLLPDAPQAPALPLFLTTRTWVDLRPGKQLGAQSGLDRLIWGITGQPQKPGGENGQGRRVQPPLQSPEPGATVSALRQTLFQTRSLNELERLRNRVRELIARFPGQAQVMDLADDLEKAIQAELRAARPATPTPRMRLTPTWMTGAALSVALVALGAWLWGRLAPVGPETALVNQPTSDWIATWRGEIVGLGDSPTTPSAVQIVIAATRSDLEIRRRDGQTCRAPVAVAVSNRQAGIWTQDPINCPDGTRIESLSLSCAEAAGGNADCVGRFGVDQPIRITLARQGGGAWSLARPSQSAVSPETLNGRSNADDPIGAQRDGARPTASAGPAAQSAVHLDRPPPGPQGPTPTDPKVETFRDCADCPEMVIIPAGSFQMGSPDTEQGRDSDEGPVHTVTFDRPFAIGKYEVTFDQWDACMRDGGCRHSPDDPGWGPGSWPVSLRNWDHAQEYVRWLGKKTGQPYRLPSESEWEYAARAGSTTARFWGNDPGGACRYANVSDQTGGWENPFGSGGHPCDDHYATIAPVGRFAPNAFGLNDMLGNVQEWTLDCWNDSYRGAPSDGSAWTRGDCERRVFRGGSWLDDPAGVRAANRWGTPAIRFYGSGFRPARTR